MKGNLNWWSLKISNDAQAQAAFQKSQNAHVVSNIAIVLFIKLLTSVFQFVVPPDGHDMMFVKRTYIFVHLSILFMCYLLLRRWPQYTPIVIFCEQCLVSLYFVAASWWLCDKTDEKEKES